MVYYVIRDIIKDIGNSFFSIIADEYTDISNREQLTLCVRWIDQVLNAHENFLGFYNIPNINSITIAYLIKDALLRLQLSLDNCKGQCYDGANNMVGHLSGVAKLIKDAFRVILEENATNIHTFGDILKSVKKVPSSKLHLIPDVMQIIRLILVSPATCATGERTFTLARGLKTWLRATMCQERFNSLAI